MAGTVYVPLFCFRSQNYNKLGTVTLDQSLPDYGINNRQKSISQNSPVEGLILILQTPQLGRARWSKSIGTKMMRKAHLHRIVVIIFVKIYLYAYNN